MTLSGFANYRPPICPVLKTTRQQAQSNLPAREAEHRLPAMFDTIAAELTTAADKLVHLRRFL
jgi:hypothetical protein